MHKYFKSILSFILLSFFLVPPVSAGERELTFSSETIFRVFEREKEGEENIKVIPAYEYLDVDYGAPELTGFSFHANGWGRADFGDQAYYEEDFDGYLLNGYIEYFNSSNGLDMKLGRQHIYSGIINNSLDGIGLKGYAGSHVSMLAFGGLPVGYEDENGRTKDRTFGGRLSLQQFYPGEAGLSYINISDDDETVENKLGIDLSAFLFNRYSFSGLSFWNLETENWGEHSYSLDVYIDQYLLNAHYQMFQYEGYFSNSTASQPFSYLQDTDEILTVMGGDIIWQKLHNLDAGVKVNHYTYDKKRETSRYIAAVFNVYGEKQTTVGAETGIMDGDSSENNYYLGRIYFYWDSLSGVLDNWFFDGEVMYIYYDEAVFEKDNSVFTSAGCGCRMLDDKLITKFSADYSSDPYHDSDIRLMTVIEYEH